MLEFGFEPLETALDDGLLELVNRHYDEIARDKDRVPLAIDLEEYIKMEDDGRVKLFTAREDGVLVGYILFYFFCPERYRTTLYVEDSMYWLGPELRKGWNGLKFLSAAKQALPRPCKLQMRVKLSFANGEVGNLMEKIGLKPIEMVYSEFLED